jgi:hypothetical protein
MLVRKKQWNALIMPGLAAGRRRTAGASPRRWS